MQTCSVLARAAHLDGEPRRVISYTISKEFSERGLGRTLTASLSPQEMGLRYSASLLAMGTTTLLSEKNVFRSMPEAASDSS